MGESPSSLRRQGERTLLIYYLITDLLPGRAIGDATTCTGTPDVDLPV